MHGGYESDAAQVGEDYADLQLRAMDLAMHINATVAHNNFVRWYQFLIRSPDDVFLAVMTDRGLGHRALMGLRAVNGAQAADHALTALIRLFGGANRFPRFPRAFDGAPWWWGPGPQNHNWRIN